MKRLQMVTANRLSDGAVVYMTPKDDWSRAIADGRAAESSEVDGLLAIAERSVADCDVVQPYAIEIDVDANANNGGRRVTAVRFRERIRADGPTVADWAV